MIWRAADPCSYKGSLLPTRMHLCLVGRPALSFLSSQPAPRSTHALSCSVLPTPKNACALPPASERKSPSRVGLCDFMDYSLPGSSVLGFSRQGYWSGYPYPSSRGSSQPRDGTQVSCTTGGFFYCLSHQGSWGVLKRSRPLDEIWNCFYSSFFKKQFY